MVGARDGYVYAGSLHLTIISTIKASSQLTRTNPTSQEKKPKIKITGNFAWKIEILENFSEREKNVFMSDIYVQSPNMPFKDSKVMSAMHS